MAASSFADHVGKIVENTQLNEKIIHLALSAYQFANKQAVVKKNILTIVDYSQPSTARRLYVIDLKTDKLLMNTWVAHGRNTGQLLSKHFSNAVESKQSSVGVFLTEGAYIGKNGHSLVLNGLEKNINHNAKARHLVIHGADYVSESFIKKTGRIGRSFGCLAVSAKDIDSLIQLTKNGSVLFSYALQEDSDPFLKG